jgi:hypothetical protein
MKSVAGISSICSEGQHMISRELEVETKRGKNQIDIAS